MKARCRKRHRAFSWLRIRYRKKVVSVRILLLHIADVSDCLPSRDQEHASLRASYSFYPAPKSPLSDPVLDRFRSTLRDQPRSIFRDSVPMSDPLRRLLFHPEHYARKTTILSIEQYHHV